MCTVRVRLDPVWKAWILANLYCRSETGSCRSETGLSKRGWKLRNVRRRRMTALYADGGPLAMSTLGVRLEYMQMGLNYSVL